MRRMQIHIMGIGEFKPVEQLAVIEQEGNGLFGVVFPTLMEKSYLGFVEPSDAVRYADSVLREEGLLT